MKRYRFPKILLALAIPVVALAMAAGCSDDDGGDDDVVGGQALSVAGRWTLTAEGMFPMTLDLTHAGTAVGGTVTDAEDYATGITGSTAAPAGDTEGSRAITLVVTFSDGQIATFSGNVARDNASMDGGYDTNWGGEDGWSAAR